MEYFAAGVGAAMTGHGADLLIIDDRTRNEMLCPQPHMIMRMIVPSGLDRDSSRVAQSLFQTRWSRGCLGGY